MSMTNGEKGRINMDDIKTPEGVVRGRVTDLDFRSNKKEGYKSKEARASGEVDYDRGDFGATARASVGSYTDNKGTKDRGLRSIGAEVRKKGFYASVDSDPKGKDPYIEVGVRKRF